MRIAVIAATILLSSAAPILAATLDCPAGSERRIAAELYFGRNIGETLGVTEEAWARFVDEDVTPRFPNGLSVFEIKGQWRDTASGRIVREPGKLLKLLIADDAPSQTKVAEIVDIYKKRHQQQSVLAATAHVCAAF